MEEREIFSRLADAVYGMQADKQFIIHLNDFLMVKKL